MGFPSQPKLIERLAKNWNSKEPKEKVYLALGCVFLLLAVVGIFLPVIPQVPFAIIASILFSKASPRLHRWMRTNKYFGEPVRNWEDHRVIKPKLKLLSAVTLIFAMGIVVWKLSGTWVYVINIGFVMAILFVLAQRSKTQTA